jgi:hypothetical protein
MQSNIHRNYINSLKDGGDFILPYTRVSRDVQEKIREKVTILLRGCNQKFPDWPPGARTANYAALCH